MSSAAEGKLNEEIEDASKFQFRKMTDQTYDCFKLCTTEGTDHKKLFSAIGSGIENLAEAYRNAVGFYSISMNAKANNKSYAICHLKVGKVTVLCYVQRSLGTQRTFL